MLIFSPVLALSGSTGQITLDTNACNVQAGCVLLQKQLVKKTEPAEDWTCSLTKTELKCDTTQHEYLAIVCAVLLLRTYLEGLEGTWFTIRTDHDSLRLILNQTESTDKLARCRLRLSNFDSVIVHAPALNSNSQMCCPTHQLEKKLPTC